MKNKKEKQIVGQLIYGVHPIVEMLKAKRRKLITLYTTKPEPKGFKEVKKVFPKYKVPVQYVQKDVLSKMVFTKDHQGIVAWVGQFPLRKKLFDPSKQKFLVMLDSIQDPRNVGAILRSAYCAGADGVVITKKDSAKLNATVFKSAAGLAEYLEIFVASSAISAAQELKNVGYNLYLAAFGGKKATECDFKQPCCIVIGNEATGITKNIYKYGSQVTLPQKTSDISYNASVAAGILLFLAGTLHKRI